MWEVRQRWEKERWKTYALFALATFVWRWVTNAEGEEIKSYANQPKSLKGTFLLPCSYFFLALLFTTADYLPQKKSFTKLDETVSRNMFGSFRQQLTKPRRFDKRQYCFCHYLIGQIKQIRHMLHTIFCFAIYGLLCGERERERDTQQKKNNNFKLTWENCFWWRHTLKKFRISFLSLGFSVFFA